jgi:acetyl-CoA C-acetyltransferase
VPTDPRTPVIAGVGQVKGDPDDPDRDPIDLFATAARRAGSDAGAPLLHRVDTIASVMLGSVRAPDPARLVADRLGLDPPRTVLAGVGGNTPQLLANELGARILRGEVDVALVGGGECLAGRGPLRSTVAPRERGPAGGPEPERIGDSRPGSSDEEMRHGMSLPVQVYPLFETALRAARGHGVDEHQRAIGELWSHFSAAAAANPYAWSREALSAEEIATPGPDNRVVCWPYLKRMCARMNVDLGAAFLLCSYEAAQAAGVPDDRLVFLHAGADGHDHWFPSTRWSVGAAPAIGVVVHDALHAAGLGADDVARFDLYSCFPSAVQMALDAIGLAGPPADPRPLTLTGGLAFAGGPLNNYVSHSIAAMIEACRADPGSIGVTTALGWYATKHSAGIWSARPPASGAFVRVDPAASQARADALPARTTTGPYDGVATIEATEVVVDRDGSPALLVVLALTGDGRRVVASTTDADLAAEAMASALEGRPAAMRAAGEHTVFLG